MFIHSWYQGSSIFFSRVEILSNKYAQTQILKTEKFIGKQKREISHKPKNLEENYIKYG